ncbi:mucin TcMUCII [Trypanosoma cruzi cruzi]|nr:mucin TcMUCII [Trypanosoma cruzi cruzi]
MTTCRLLCALLVLALCCCLSVCVIAGDAEPGGSGEPPSPDAPGPANSALGLATRKVPETVMTDALNKPVKTIGGEPSEKPSTKQGGTSVSGQSGLDGKKKPSDTFNG